MHTMGVSSHAYCMSFVDHRAKVLENCFERDAIKFAYRPFFADCVSLYNIPITGNIDHGVVFHFIPLNHSISACINSCGANETNNLWLAVKNARGF